ncbi:MAG: FecCD family ABC transporter permease [Rectinema subterraneum]|uniref:FecCD family ABC transporter permease n=1 Tax=Rectinema subterraneum TaxID=2653714 RepID=UPI003C7C2351
MSSSKVEKEPKGAQVSEGTKEPEGAQRSGQAQLAKGATRSDWALRSEDTARSAWAHRHLSALLVGLLLIVFALALFMGRYPKPGFLNPAALVSDPLARQIVLNSRLPRMLGAVLLGLVLGGAGASLQAVFGNPLVDAGFLGVSQGAAFGAAVALVLGLRAYSLIAVLAFGMAVLALALSLWLAERFRYGGQILRLILAGLAVSAFFSSLLAMMKYVADPLSQLPDIVFWTMGSMVPMGWKRLESSAPIALVALAVLYAMRWRVNLLSLDDTVSHSLGIRPGVERKIVSVAAAAGVGVMTAVCGVVGWVGLVVPQIVRAIDGPDGRSVLPRSMLGGAIFVLVSDTLARSLFSGEIPLGIVTSLVGALSFAILLTMRKVELAR